VKTPLPGINPAAHLSPEELEARFSALPTSPRELGRVTLLLARDADSARTVPPRARLTPEGGMPGDRWALKQPLNPDAQLAVMEHGPARLIANGQPLTLFGDNLALDLDLSAEALPIGSRLQAGQALLEVTPKAHTGCSKYRDRFGAEALRYISAPERRHLRLRGLYLKVIEAGDVWVGAEVRVLSRGEPASD
jgi:MOSC domain-containing protein YiiM